MDLLNKIKQHRWAVTACVTSAITLPVVAVGTYFGVPAVAEFIGSNWGVSAFFAAGTEALLVAAATTVGKLIDDRRIAAPNAAELVPFVAQEEVDAPHDFHVLRVEADLKTIKEKCAAIMQKIASAENQEQQEEKMKFIEAAKVLFQQLQHYLQDKDIPEGKLSIPRSYKPHGDIFVGYDPLDMTGQGMVAHASKILRFAEDEQRAAAAINAGSYETVIASAAGTNMGSNRGSDSFSHLHDQMKP